MPSKLAQLNCRPGPVALAALEELRAALAEERGRPVSQADAITYALVRAAKTVGKKSGSIPEKSRK